MKLTVRGTHNSRTAIEQGPARLDAAPWAQRILDLGNPARTLPNEHPSSIWPETTTLRREPGTDGWTGLFWATRPDPIGRRDEYALITDPDGVGVAFVLRGDVRVDHQHPANGIVTILRTGGPFIEPTVPEEVWQYLRGLHAALLDALAWLDHPGWADTDPLADEASGRARDDQVRRLLGWAPYGYTAEEARDWESVEIISAAHLRGWLSRFDPASVRAWAPHFRSWDVAAKWATRFDDPAVAAAWDRTYLLVDTAADLHALGWDAATHGRTLHLRARVRRDAPPINLDHVVPVARTATEHGLTPEDVLTLLSAEISPAEADTALTGGTLDLDGLRAMVALRA